MINGVVPVSVFAWFTSVAAWASSSRTTPSWPFSHAMINGVAPFSFPRFTSTPSIPSSTSTMPSRPVLAAVHSG